MLKPGTGFMLLFSLSMTLPACEKKPAYCEKRLDKHIECGLKLESERSAHVKGCEENGPYSEARKTCLKIEDCGEYYACVSAAKAKEATPPAN